MFWLFVVACNGSSSKFEATPAGCRALDDPSLLATCVLAEIESTPLPENAHEFCDLLDEKDGNECHFRIAERTDNPTQCAHAGDFEANCRLHVFSQRFHKWLKPTLPFQEIAIQTPPFITDVGLAPEDPRPWSAVWRSVLGAHSPLDRSLCTSLVNPMHQEACAHTAVALFHDQLTRAWTQGIDLCTGALPPHLAPTPDPVFEDVLARRRKENLCTKSPFPPPPGATLPGTLTGAP
ncbi:MAG: hypothetical protein VX519_08220 [Myxococcota bacterium]|nr:hypothetical protein [Myxococcota bacterium]